MKVKNVNPLERHAEKITLILAALAAAYLGYANFVKDPDTVALAGRPVRPSAVESQVGKAVANVKAKLRIDRKKRFDIAGVLPNFVPRYKAMENKPLPRSVLAMGPVELGPVQVPVKAVSMGGASSHYVFVVPSAPAPRRISAAGHRGVADLGHSRTRDITWVRVAASFPMLAWRASLAGVGKTHGSIVGLPSDHQETIFRRVQARRQELLPDGQWGPWHNVHGFYLRPLPKVHLRDASSRRVRADLQALSRRAYDILMPAFYRVFHYHPQNNASRPAGNRRQNLRRLHQIQQANLHNRAFGGGRPGLRGGGFRPPFGGPGGRFRGPPNGAPGGGQYNIPAWVRKLRHGAGPGVPPPGAGPAGGWRAGPQPNNGNNPVAAPAGAGGLTGKTRLGIRFYDTSVEPGYTYRYAIRVVLYNPVYNFRFKLTQPAAKNQAWLVSPWSKPSGPVHVKRSSYFFLVSNRVHRGGSVTFRTYFWKQGIWVVSEGQVYPGQEVGGRHTALLTNPATGQMERSKVNFNTGYVLVDAMVGHATPGVAAVLLSPQKELVMHDSMLDNADPRRRALDRDVRRSLPRPARRRRRRMPRPRQGRRFHGPRRR